MRNKKSQLVILLEKWNMLGWELYYYNFASLILKKVIDTEEYYLGFDQNGFRASKHFGESLKITPKELLLANKTMNEIKIERLIK